MKATLEDLENRARLAIARREQVCFDICADLGQIFRNVKHMDWFLKTVMEEFVDTTKKYRHIEVPK